MVVYVRGRGAVQQRIAGPVYIMYVQVGQHGLIASYRCVSVG